MMGWGSVVARMITGLLLILVLVESAQTGGPSDLGPDSNDATKMNSSFTFSLSYGDPTGTSGTADTNAVPKLKRSESIKMNKAIKASKKICQKLIRRHSDNSTEDEEGANERDEIKMSRLNQSTSDPMRPRKSSNENKRKSPQTTRTTSRSPESDSPKKSPRFISISPFSSSPPSPDEKRKSSRSSPTFPPRLDMLIRRKSINEKHYAEEKRRSRKNSSESSETGLEQAIEEAVGERRRRASDSLLVSNESIEAKSELEKQTRKRSLSSSSDTVSPKPSPPPKRSSSKSLTKRFSFRRSSHSESHEETSDSDGKESLAKTDVPDLDQFVEKWSDSKEFVYQFKLNRKACQSTLQKLLALFPVEALVEALEAHDLLLCRDESDGDFLQRVASHQETPPWQPDIILPIVIKWAFIGTLQSTIIETYLNILIGPTDMGRALYLLVAEDERRLLMGQPPLDPVDFASPIHFRALSHHVVGLDCPLARIFHLMYGDYLPKKMRKAIADADGNIKAALFGCVKRDLRASKHKKP